MFVSSFSGDLWFLSNMYPRYVTYGTRQFTCSECLYMSFKTTDKTLIEKISAEKWSGYSVKRFFRENKQMVRDDWQSKYQLNAMWTALNAKFSDSTMLAMLQSAPVNYLVERNNWGDKYWGVDKSGRGENMLGKMLQAIKLNSEKIVLPDDLKFVETLNKSLTLSI